MENTSVFTPKLQTLLDNTLHLQKILSVYDNFTSSTKLLLKWIDNEIPSIFDSIVQTIPLECGFKALSVGPGNGQVDSKVLTHLRLPDGCRRTQAVIVEPHVPYLRDYQDLAQKESVKLRGIDFEWRAQTFQEYEAAADAALDKFHFISCFSSIYYMGSLDQSVKMLYDMLHTGGLLLMTVATDDSGWGRMSRFNQERLNSTGRRELFCTNGDLKDLCTRLCLPKPEVQTVHSSLDISECFQEPMSEEGSALLDVLTQMVDFDKEAPSKLRDEVMGYLESDCTERGPDGETLIDESISIVILRRQ